MKIAVAGGTGVVGRFVVEAVRGNGDEPVVLSRSTGVDLTTGAGLDAALAGVDAVIDVSNIETMSRKKATAFFETGTRNLLAAEQRAGVGHHVLLSIVGIDRVGLGYYAAKLSQEQAALAGPVPATVLRATQFHEFAGQMLDRTGPVVIGPKMLSQPVAAREVGQLLADLARRPPAGRVPDLAGPQQLDMSQLVRRVAKARGVRKPIVAFRLPGKVGTAMATGGSLPDADGPRGSITFDEWLASENAGNPPG
ncbi:SDR family oxidoreductase [Nakamurella lactea]|uniref:SDR family oxidoreductase n=1 Tax=Nakamurella lactea TaxID=459515 RepID=UPI000423888F|nr:NAD-dependent epimerase/dehydratase family protein [Nakamurella lactea]